jgi:two-component system phosphate regulon response regulator OmpR
MATIPGRGPAAPAGGRRRRPHPRPDQGVSGPGRVPGHRRRRRRRGAQAAGALQFDLLVLDVMMPGEDGFSLTTWLRERAGERGRDAGPDPHRPRPARRPHRGPAAGRGRLSGQALRAAGTGAAHRGDPAARAPFGRPAAGSALGAALRSGARRAHRDDAPVRLTEGEASCCDSWPAPPTRRSTARARPADGAEASGRAVDIQVTRLRRKIEPDPPTRAICRPCAGSATC